MCANQQDAALHNKNQQKRNKTRLSKALSARAMVGTSSASASAGSLAISYFSPDPFPPSVRKQLRYCENFQLSVGTAGICGTEVTLALNSLYDPNLSGTGHQPYGFDQMAALYTKYRVDSVNVLLEFTTPGSTVDQCCIAAFEGIAQQSTTGTAIDQVCERPNVFKAHLSSSGRRHAVIQKSFNLWQLVGVSQIKYTAEDGYAAACTASPANIPVCRFNVCNYSQGTAAASSCLLTLTFNAIFYGRIGQAQS
jgi:hypothetical protein